jgi:hypothetical protein
MGQLLLLYSHLNSLFSFTIFSFFSLLPSFRAISNTASAAPLGFGYVPTTLQNILSNTHGSDLYSYPTDLTRAIVPVSRNLPSFSYPCFTWFDDVEIEAETPPLP